MSAQVLCIGNTLLDLYFHVETAPQISFENNLKKLILPVGAKIPVENAGMKLGGCAAHVAIGLSRLSLSSAIMAETGGDGIGQWMKDMLDAEQVDTLCFHVKKGATASFAAILDVKADRTEFVHHEVRDHHFNLQEITAPWMYLGSVGESWEDLYEAVGEKVSQNASKLICNPGSLQLLSGIQGLQNIMKNSFVFVVNKEEAQRLVGKEKREEQSFEKRDLAHELLQYGSAWVVITDGENGSWALSQKGEFSEQRAIPVEVLEKTGAGDAYVAGLLGALMIDKTMKEALLWGAINSASVVANGGVSEGLLSLTAMEKAVIKQKEL